MQNNFNDLKKKSKDEILRMNTTVLSWLGDAVYELRIREYLAASGKTHADRLHRESVRYVKAAAQARVIKSVFDELSEDEQWLVKRARNRKPKTIPKNADLLDYKWASALEALIGYYHLTEQSGKSDKLLDIAIDLL